MGTIGGINDWADNRTRDIRLSISGDMTKDSNDVASDLDTTADYVVDAINEVVSDLSDLETNVGNLESLPVPQIITENSGRILCDTNNSWVTPSHHQYGFNRETIDKTAGTGSDPTVEDDHLGLIVLPGRKLVKFVIMGACTSNTESIWSDMEISIQKATPASGFDWDSGIDAPSELDIVEIYRDNFWTNTDSTFTGAYNDQHLRIVDIDPEDGTIDEPSIVSVYFKPVGTRGSSVHFEATWQWIWEQV